MAICWSVPMRHPCASGASLPVGIAFISVVIGPKGQPMADPDIVFDGVPETDSDGRDMIDIALDAVEQTLRSIPPQMRRDPDRVEDAVCKAVRSALEEAWGKRPIVKCIVTKIDGRA
jgi:ribonuclease J